MSQVPEAQTVQVAPQTQAAREECVYVLKVVKTRGRDKILVLQQPSLESDCPVFPKMMFRWLEVEPWKSEIRKLVYDLQERRGYVILEVRGRRNIWLGRTEPNEPALYVYNPRILE
jgi:hypothetical protein